MGSKIRVNVRSTVKNSQIRRERTEDGRQVIIVPSATLPDDVIMNGGLYPADEIAKSYKSLEGTPAPLGHPVSAGQLLNATHPAAINGFWVGAYNANVRREKGRVFLDKIIDVEVAERTEGGRRLIDAINAGAPIHTSTGLTCDREMVDDQESYQWIARNMIFDHDAILLDEPGAATPEQGVGMMVNGQQVEVINVDTADAVLSPDSSAREKRQRIEDALPSGAWVIDYDDERAVYDHEGETQSVAYSDDGETVTITGDPEPVAEKSSWIKKLPLVNKILSVLQSSADKNPGPGGAQDDTTDEVPTMDKKELEEILAANNQAAAEAIAEAIKPLAALVESVDATMKANQLAAEAEKRAAVEEVLGKDAADALTGNALEEAHKRLVVGNAAGIKPSDTAGKLTLADYETAPEG